MHLYKRVGSVTVRPMKQTESQTVLACQSAREFLRRLYLDRKEVNPAYSTRAFARNLGMSQTYVSLVFSGKREVSLKQAMKIAAHLHLGAPETDHFLEGVLTESDSPRSRVFKRRLEHERRKNEATDSSAFVTLEIDHFRLIAQWYHLPILDLTTTRGFKSDLVWVARKLGISPIEVREAVERLERIGLLKIDSRGKWTKTNAKIFFPSHTSEESIRAFHKQMGLKAINALEDNSPDAFSKRSISGTTMAVNPAKMAEAKKKIEKFQKELASFVTEGPCTEVYQLNVQFFSLTKGEVK